jgi:hypothetical protein
MAIKAEVNEGGVKSFVVNDGDYKVRLSSIDVVEERDNRPASKTVGQMRPVFRFSFALDPKAKFVIDALANPDNAGLPATHIITTGRAWNRGNGGVISPSRLTQVMDGLTDAPLTDAEAADYDIETLIGTFAIMTLKTVVSAKGNVYNAMTDMYKYVPGQAPKPRATVDDPFAD